MEPFKNFLNATVAKEIASLTKQACPDFNEQEFLKNIENELDSLELKARSHLIADRLIEHLPKNPPAVFKILLKTLKSVKNKNGLEGFEVWPLTMVVEKLGLSHFEESMNALKEMTKVFTAEFAIRSFLIKHEKETLKILTSWLKDENEHVRRLVSEGTRPLLPWGQKLESFVKDPKKTIHLLEYLKHDSSKYVQKSVANHLNDHSKNHSDFLISLFNKWKKENSNEIEWIIKHASRTLIKSGNPHALLLQGVKPFKIDQVQTKILTPRFKLGRFFQTELIIQNKTKHTHKLVIDHEFMFLKANGSHGKKVIKGKTVEIEPNETLKLSLQVKLKKITTRVYHEGKQSWGLLINGARTEKQWFHLSF